MATLGSLAKLIRSKNAGPWMLTVDVMLPDQAVYRRVVDSGAITKETVGAVFHVAPELVQLYEYAPANAIKFSFPRHLPNGHPADSDIFGGQQFAPLVDLEIPDEDG